MPFAEERTDVGGHESRIGEGVPHAALLRERAKVVPVVEDVAAAAAELEHRLHVPGHAREGALLVLHWIADPQLRRFLHGHPRRDVSIQWIVRRGLVGQQIRPDPAPYQLGEHLGGVADHADALAPAIFQAAGDLGQALLERGREPIEISLLDPPPRARGIHLHAEEGGAAHRRRQRLRAAHASQPGADHQAAGEVVGAEVLPPGRGEGLVGALQDALRPDVDPRPGRHLSVHDQAGALELAELLPGGPLGDQVRVRQQHPRRIRVRAQDADRLAALYQQGLLVAQRLQGGHDPVEARPIPRGLPAPAVHDQLFGLLRHLRVEVVLQHPQRGFLHPSPARERGAACGANLSGHARFYDTVDRFRVMEDWRRNLIEDDEGRLLELLRSARRVAVLGIKTEAARGQAAYYVPQALQEMGLEILPVPVYYPDATQILGQKVYRRVSDVPGEVDIVDVFRRSNDVAAYLPDLLAKKPKAVWFQLGIRNDRAAQRLAEAGIEVVQDRCLMVDHQRYL